MTGEAIDPRPDIARNLRRLMESRRISREQLGERAEISAPRIDRFLAAESEPTARDLLRLASALEASVAELLGPPDD